MHYTSTQHITKLHQLINNKGKWVKTAWKIICCPFLSPPLHQSESFYLGCPSSFDVAAISKGTFVPLGRRAVHSTDPPPYKLNGEKVAWHVDQTDLPSHRYGPSALPFFIGEEGRGGVEWTDRRKSAEVLVFPWECSLGGQGFFVELLSWEVNAIFFANASRSLKLLGTMWSFA